MIGQQPVTLYWPSPIIMWRTFVQLELRNEEKTYLTFLSPGKLNFRLRVKIRQIIDIGSSFIFSRIKKTKVDFFTVDCDLKSRLDEVLSIVCQLEEPFPPERFFSLLLPVSTAGWTILSHSLFLDCSVYFYVVRVSGDAGLFFKILDFLSGAVAVVLCFLVAW